MNRFLLATLAALLSFSSAQATDAVEGVGAPGLPQGGVMSIQGVSGGTGIPITGSVTASYSGFTPSSYITAITTTGSSVAAALTGATSTSTIVIYNKGTYPAYVSIGNSGVTATANSDVVFPNCFISYAAGVSSPYIATLQNGSPTNLNVAIGSGAATTGCAATISGLSTVSQGTQGSAASAWYVQPGTGATWAVTESGTWNINNVSGTISLPSNAAQETGGNLATIAGSISSGVVQENLKQVNGATVAIASTGAPLVGIEGHSGGIVDKSAGGAAAANSIQVEGVNGGQPLPISGTVSATIGNFAPTPSYITPLTVTTSSSRVGVPTGTSVIIYNVGSVDAYVTLGNGSVVATTSMDIVKAGGWMQYTLGSNTYLAAITATGSTTLNISGGAGIAAGAGSSSGSGGGGTVTQGSAGSASSAWYVQPGTGATFPVSIASLPPLATGGNVIGSISNTTFGSTITQWGGATLGAGTNWGTAPSGVVVANVNSDILACATSICPSPISLGDGVSTSTLTTGQPVTGPAMLWNGTSYDRQYEATGQIGVAAVATAPAAFSDQWRGTASTAGTSAVTVPNSSLASNHTYVTDIECGRSDAGTTAIVITLNDSASTAIVIPNSGGGGGWNKTFGTPLRISSTGTSLTFTSASGVSTLYCNVQGFFATN